MAEKQSSNETLKSQAKSKSVASTSQRDVTMIFYNLHYIIWYIAYYSILHIL
jgi:hypothetical protein